MSGGRLRAVVVGAGRMGRIRAHHLVELGTEVVAVVDSERTRAAILAQEIGCSALSAVDEIDFHHLDFVVLCTPPGLRAGADHKALRTGTALFLEKPAALDASAIRTLLDLQRVSGAVVGVGYMHRGRETVRRAREFIAASGAFAASARWVGGTYNVGWWRARAAAGGPFNEQATHAVDLLIDLLGPVDRVEAIGDRQAAEAADVVVSALRFTSGALASLLYSCAADEKDIRVEVYTPRGVVRLHGWDLDLELGNFMMRGNPHGDRNAVFRDEMSIFIDAVRAKDCAAPLCNLESAYRTQLVVDAIIAAVERFEQRRLPVQASC